MLEQELDKSRDTIRQLESDAIRKDEALVDLKTKLDRANEKSLLSTANPSKASSVMKASAGKKLEDLVLSPSPPTDFSYLKNNYEKNNTAKEEAKGPMLQQEPSQLKRKYNELPKMESALLGIGEENSNSKSSTTSYNNRKEEMDNSDDLKFKKMFKKVKRSENSKENQNQNTTSNPFHSTFNEPKKNEQAVTTKPNRLSSFDADSSLQNLLNNFLDVKETSNSNPFMKKKNNSKNEQSKINFENQQLLPASLSADEAFEIEHSAKVYKKAFDMVNFSQKSPLKSLDEPIEPLHSQAIPITRNGRAGMGSETTMQLMKKMLNTTKKRNSYDVGGMFRMGAKNNNKDYPENSKSTALHKINDDDLVRAAYRSKAEREDLTGYDCDQCKKVFFNFRDYLI